MNMIKNFTKETKKTVIKQKIKKNLSSAKKFGIAAAGISVLGLIGYAVAKTKKKISRDKVTKKKGTKPKGYIIDAELIDDEAVLALEHKKKKNIKRQKDGTLAIANKGGE